MNKSPLTSILTGALGLSALVSLILCYLFIQYTRESRTIQSQLNSVNLKRAIVMALANDAVEYSKSNPAIKPILQAAGALPAVPAQPAARPAH